MIFTKDGNIIVKDGKVISCNTCPCNADTTDAYFVDIVQFDEHAFLRSNLNSWPAETSNGNHHGNAYDGDCILQSNDLLTLYEYTSGTDYPQKGDVLVIPQIHLYNIENLNDQIYTNITYNTVQLTYLNNNSWTGKEDIFKQYCWFYHEQNYWYYHVVCGNVNELFIDTQNLNTQQLEFSIDPQNFNSGYISSIVLNNVNYDYDLNIDYLCSMIIPYALTGDSGYVRDSDDNIYYIYENKVDDIKQFYATRVYKGSREGYGFSKDYSPNNSWWENDYMVPMSAILNTNAFIGGAENIPVAGKTYYYTLGRWNDILIVQKIGTQYYRYNLRNRKTLELIQPSQVSSFTLEEDTQNFNNPHYTNLKFNIDDEIYYIYKLSEWGAISMIGPLLTIATGIVVNMLGDELKYYYYNDLDILLLINESDIKDDYYGYDTNTLDLLFYPVKKDNNNGYYYIDCAGDYIILTGGAYLNYQNSTALDDGSGIRPPHSFYDANADYIYLIRKGIHIINHSYYNCVLPVIPFYYDTVYGNLINTLYTFSHYSFEYEDRWFTPLSPIAKKVISQKKFKDLFPCVNFIQTQHTWVSKGSVTNSNFISHSNHTSTGTPTSTSIYTSDLITSYDANGYSLQGWGWADRPIGEPGSNQTWNNININTSIPVCKFSKMNDTEITNFCNNYGIDSSLATNFDTLCGIYCEIMTGFWLRKYGEGAVGDGSAAHHTYCGIRKHGFIYQTLALDTDYHFGIDMINYNELNSILSADEYPAITIKNSNLSTTTGKKYWQMLSAYFNDDEKLSAMINIGKFLTFYYVRPISGVYNTTTDNTSNNNVFDTDLI